MQGAQGSQGNQGYQGNAGPQGFQGSAGAQGATGAQGAAGANGAQGAAGAAGSQGSQGVPGTNGTNGTNGAQGAQGSTGAQGSQGSLLAFANFISSTTQTVNTGDNVTLGTVQAQVGLTGNITNSGAIITLQPGTYWLEGGVGATQTTSLLGTGTGMGYTFYNITAGAYIGQMGGHAAGNVSYSYSDPQGAAVVGITVTAPTQIALRISNLSQTSTINQQGDGQPPVYPASMSWVTVMQVG
ncbi:hypothetical protein GCM10022287_31100 [Gryllotalpicola koreensis]|uniref:Collagen-like protein n=1 Tax=Gryllotalpicola koreensis TaxID=993086 RepID=A0ABP8A759_9MICO